MLFSFMVYDKEKRKIMIEILTLILAFFMLVATFTYVYFTYKLTQETAKLREIETSPFISLHIEAEHSGSMNVIVQNIGKAPAYNISFDMDEKFVEYFHCGCSFKDNISYFPPTQKIIFSLDSFEKLSKCDFDNISINVKYYTKENFLIEDRFVLEWKHLSGMALETNYIKGIKNELEKIQKHIEKLVVIKDKKDILNANDIDRIAKSYKNYQEKQDID